MKYSQTYKKSWENEPAFQKWLTCNKDKDDAFCKLCNKSISIKSTGRAAVVRHSDSAGHQVLIKSQKGQQKLSFKKVSNVEDMQKKIDLYLAAFVSEHNLPYKIMEHLPQLLPKLCPDSELAKSIKCGRTKCSALIKNTIGKKHHIDVCIILRTTKFSLIVDESTDRGCSKHLCLVCRYHYNDK